jgi:hypothetical protein
VYSEYNLFEEVYDHMMEYFQVIDQLMLNFHDMNLLLDEQTIESKKMKLSYYLLNIDYEIYVMRLIELMLLINVLYHQVLKYWINPNVMYEHYYLNFQL